jgi:hypothetical protein
VKYSIDDTLFRDALLKIPLDIFYDVVFRESKALGVVLERAGEWALAKLADTKETGVHVGSALTCINDELVMFDTYNQTIGTLKNWRPPLKLRFRKAPSKTGYLRMRKTKEADDAIGKLKWRKIFLSLGEGKLRFMNSEAPTEEIKGEVPLLGAAVFYASYQEAGAKFCFRFLSGSFNVTFRASSHAEMREWAAMIYHAIAVASGGKHILDYDRIKINAERRRLDALDKQVGVEDHKEIFDKLIGAIQSKSVPFLKEGLQEAEDNEIVGDFIDYSKEQLQVLINDEAIKRQDDETFQQVAMQDMAISPILNNEDAYASSNAENQKVLNDTNEAGEGFEADGSELAADTLEFDEEDALDLKKELESATEVETIEASGACHQHHVFPSYFLIILTRIPMLGGDHLQQLKTWQKCTNVMLRLAKTGEPISM